MTSTELTEDYRFDSAAEVDRLLRAADYLTDSKIATVVHLGDRLRKPVLVEGPRWRPGRRSWPSRSPGSPVPG